jgi:hypothetical protein
LPEDVIRWLIKNFYTSEADSISFSKFVFNYFDIQVTVEVLRGDHKEKIAVKLEPKPDES